MKKILVIGFLSLSLPAIAQEITQKNGLYGYKDERGTQILPPEYRGIKQVETADGQQFLVFAKADPAQNPSSAEDPFNPEANTFEKGLAEGMPIGFNERFLFGIMNQNNPKSRTACRYKSLVFPTRADAAHESPFLLAFDGANTDAFASNNLSKAINKPKQLQILQNVSTNWEYPYFFGHLYEDFWGRISLQMGSESDEKKPTLKTIVPPQYSNIQDFLYLNELRYFIAEMDGKTDLYNYKGEILVKQSDSIRTLQLHTNPELPLWLDFQRFLVYTNGKTGRKAELWDFSGKKPALIWSGEHAKLMEWEDRPALLFQKGDKWGLMAYADESPMQIIPAEYEQIYPMDGYLHARKGNILDIYDNEKEKLYSIPDAFSVNFDALPAGIGLLAVNKATPDPNPDGYMSIWCQDSSKYLLEYTNFWSIETSKRVLTYNRGQQDGKKGFFDLVERRKITEAVFDFISADQIPNSDGNSAVKTVKVSQNGLQGLMLWGTEQFIIPMQYAQISPYEPQYQYFVVAKKDSGSKTLRYGLLNARGEQILACEYEEIRHPQPDRYLWLSKKGGKMEVFDLKSKQWQPQMKGIEVLGEAEAGYWKVRKDNKVGKVRVNDWKFEF